MNNKEKMQWVSDMYQKWADGGVLQCRALCSKVWITTSPDSPGPLCMSSDPKRWRIKPALKVIDMSVMFGKGLDCEFWQEKIEGKFYGPLSSIKQHNSYPYALDHLGVFKQCQPRMTPHIHFWSGGDTCPVPEGFDVKLHTRGKDLTAWEPHFQHYRDHTDVIGIEFIGIKDGYTLGASDE